MPGFLDSVRHFFNGETCFTIDGRKYVVAVGDRIINLGDETTESGHLCIEDVHREKRDKVAGPKQIGRRAARRG